MKDRERLLYAVNRYSNAFSRLKEAVDENETPLAIDGTIQRFEFTFEQAWKTIQKLLRFEGYDCISPRDCLKQAYSMGIINNEEAWLDMLDDRHMTSHIYDEEHAKKIYARIKSQHFDLFKGLLNFLIDRIRNDK